MPFCTGQGTDDVGGCCHLGNGEVCPHYRSAAELPAWIEASGYKGAAKSRLAFQAMGVKHACTIAMRVIADNSRAVDDRALFEQRWHDHPDYQRDVRPYWAVLEENAGYEPDTFNCPTYQGGGSERGQEHHPGVPLACCFGQDEATCEAQAANLHTTAVTIRRPGGF